MSMYMNAGIISVFYPVSVFGYALLEEARPSKAYWITIRNYTTGLLVFKFTMNLAIFNSVLRNPAFAHYSAYVKLGLYEYDNIPDLLMYMMPEILIIFFIMLNEIKLKLLGLFEENEIEVESILEGIQRNIANGDEEAVQIKKQEQSFMCLERYFESTKEQKKRLGEYHHILADEIRAEHT